MVVLIRPRLSVTCMNFSTVLSTARTSGNAVTLELTPDWLQGRTAYGGWQAALAVLAMRAVLGDAIELRSLQINFIAPVPPGMVTASAAMLRRGKSVAQLEARILVDGTVAFTAVGIFGAGRASAVTRQPVAHAIALAADAVADWPYAAGHMPEFMRHFHVRWAQGKPPYSGAEHADASMYVRFRDDAVCSEAHLIGLADAIPPSALSVLTRLSMISSINWTLELINPLQDDEGSDWFRFDAELTAATSGYAWENTAIWSSRGRLIALSRQCIAIFG